MGITPVCTLVCILIFTLVITPVITKFSCLLWMDPTQVSTLVLTLVITQVFRFLPKLLQMFYPGEHHDVPICVLVFTLVLTLVFTQVFRFYPGCALVCTLLLILVLPW